LCAENKTVLFSAEKERARRAASAESCRHGQLTYREKKEMARMQEIEKERDERMKITDVCDG